MAVIKNAVPETFAELTGKGVVLLDFWATWCNPCRIMGKLLEQTAPEMAADVTIVKADIDQCQELAVQYQVETIPQLFLLKDGAVVKRFPGGAAMTKPMLLKEIRGTSIH